MNLVLNLKIDFFVVVFSFYIGRKLMKLLVFLYKTFISYIYLEKMISRIRYS